MKTTEQQNSIIKQYKNPKLFYFLSTCIPWAFWFTSGAISRITPHQDKYLDIASILSFIGLLAPIIIAWILISKEPKLQKDVAERFFNFKKIKVQYLVLACLIMPVSIIIGMTISLLFGYSSSQFIITGYFTFSSGIFPVWFLLIVAPVIEELAWHSYGTDSLRSRFNLFKTSLIFGLFWGVWHMPLSTIRDYYQSNILEDGWIYTANFLVSIIPYVLIMNWLYYKTERNILLIIIFHITAGLFNELFAPHPDSKIIQTGLLIILAVYVVCKDKNFFFEQKDIPFVSAN